MEVSHNGARKTATCGTLDEAILKKRELLEALRLGKATPATPSRPAAQPWTLQQALDKTMSLPPKPGWKGTSYAEKARVSAGDAVHVFGPHRVIEDLTLDDIDAWVRSCEARGNSDSTINRKTSALRKITKVAMKYGGLSRPVPFPDKRREPVGRIRQISPAEETAMLTFFERIGRQDMADACAVLIDTGMRRGELMHLRPTDVYFDNGVVGIYGVEGKGTKNGELRSVPMTQRVRSILSKPEYMSGATCFSSLSETAMRHLWDRMRAHLGMTDDPNFVLHVLRHTCASRLVQKGVSLSVVQQWMGHKTVQTTMRYAHLYPHDLMNAVKALEGDSRWTISSSKAGARGRGRTSKSSVGISERSTRKDNSLLRPEGRASGRDRGDRPLQGAPTPF